VVYAGPDTDHQGSIICLAATPEVDDELHIVDFTDPSAAVTLSSASFPDHAYSHQGWLSEDHRYFFLNDEYDEEEGFNTRTLIFDVQDLDAPAYVGHHLGSTAARTHDEYVLGDRLYQANYNAGLDILDIINPATASLERVGRFDTYPPADDNGFEGAWGTYPYLPSGTIAVSSFNEGLFLLTPRLP
jgi:choice-of-anchor B domain-containing protein